jgi:MFS family permease
MPWKEKSFDELPALAVRGETLRKSLRTVTVAWMFGIVWMSLVVGSQWTTFGQILGMGDFEFGLVSAINSGAALAQLAAAAIIERSGLRKYQFLYACATHRMLWAVMAAVPLIFKPCSFTVVLFITVYATSAILAQIATPTWLDWMGDMVPRRIRGRYFATRQAWTMPIQIVVALLAGLLLDYVTVAHVSGFRYAPAMPAVAAALPCPLLPGAGAIGQGVAAAAWTAPLFKAPMNFAYQPTLFYVLCGLFFIAAIFGTTDVLLFFRLREIISRPVIPEDERPARSPSNLWRSLGDPLRTVTHALRDRVSRHYALYWATLLFSVTLADQYFWLNALTVVGFSKLATNAVFMVFAALAAWAMARPLGGLIDRWGRRPILIIGTIGVIFSPFGWFLMKPGPAHFWGNYALATVSCILGGAAWTAVNLAANTVLLSFAEKQGRSRYMAAVAAVASLGGFAGGLVGGALCRAMEGLKANPIMVGPFPWNNYHVMFLLSAAVRGASILWLIGMPDPGAASVKTVVREIWGNIFANIRVRAPWPSRDQIVAATPPSAKERSQAHEHRD